MREILVDRALVVSGGKTVQIKGREAIEAARQSGGVVWEEVIFAQTPPEVTEA